MSATAHTIDATQANFENDVLKASLNAPVLVDFWADWCAPCKALGPVLEKLALEYNGAFTLAKVDADKEQALLGMFGVRSLPTVVMIKDGQIADGFAGALPEAETRAFLGKFVDGPALVTTADTLADAPSATPPSESPEQSIARLQAEIAADADNAELKLDLAVAFMQAGHADAARAELESLPANLAGDERAVRVHSQLGFVDALKDAPATEALRARIERDAKDLEAHDLLGLRLLVAGDTEAGLDQFLVVLKADRRWRDGLARKRLLAAFQIIDDAALVGVYRRKMASQLF